MAKKKKNYKSNIDSGKYFRSPLFLIVAILTSLIPVALVLRIIFGGIGPVLAIGLLCAIISTVHVWIVFAGKSDIKKVKKSCRIISYTRFLSTLLTIAFIAAASVVSIGLIVGALSNGSAGFFNATEILEDFVKPFAEGMVLTSEEVGESIAGQTSAGVLSPAQVLQRGFFLGVNSTAHLQEFMHRWSVVSSNVLVVLDDIILFAKYDYMLFSLVFIGVLVLVSMAMCFVNSALKNAVRQLLVLSNGVNGFRSGHRFALCAGATVLVIVGLVMAFFDPILSAVPLILGAMLYVLAMIFGDVRYEKKREEKAIDEAEEIADAAKMTVTDY